MKFSKDLKCGMAFIVIVVVSVWGNAVVFAQNEAMRSAVDYKIDHMKTALHLSEVQIVAMQPILLEYLSKRQALLEEVVGQGIVDHTAVKASLKDLKDTLYGQLGKILNEDQMKKWINKDNLMAALNPDGMGTSVDDGPTLTASGANFKF